MSRIIRDLCTGLVAGALVIPPALAVDADTDGVDDAIDNCTAVSNPAQRDTDGDGIGNRCDQDLNDDGLVNSLDLGLFKRAFFGDHDPAADFNSDGVLDMADVAILRSGFLREPGPTAVALDPALAADPPEVQAMDVAVLDTLAPGGENGALFARFSGDAVGDREIITLIQNDRVVALNDLGIAPDQQAGDGIHSGLVSLDLDALSAAEADLSNRLQGTDAQVLQFSNRHIVSELPFQPGRRPSVFEPGQEPPDGMSLIQLPFLTSSHLPVTFDKSKTLMITHADVVADPDLTYDPCNTNSTGNTTDPDAPWSFKTLMANMSPNPSDPAVVQDFIHNWLANWLTTQTVNGFPVPDRPTILGFFPGWDGVDPTTLDVDNLPFRLIAIVNRMDLGKSSPYGASTAGETRFVFGLLNACSPSPMTVIFEYGDVDASCAGQKARADDWIALDAEALGSPAYLSALKALTDTVTLPNAAPGKVNGSALNQLRTNEVALTGTGWDMREFVLDGGTQQLQYATVKQTPDANLNGTAVTDDFMESHANAILCEKHTVPLSYLSAAYLGGSIEYGISSIWDWALPSGSLPGSLPSCHQGNASFSGSPPTPAEMQSEVRHKFSLNTCDACHAAETATGFTHVDPTTPTAPANLSGFLVGSPPGPIPNTTPFSVNDPAGSGLTREFNDLERRGSILASIASQSCLVVGVGSFATAQSALTIVH
ncbi:dockerin type I domain-containing protein [uncultured Thiohalocapsa sp.]|uniref:dockerin type I domain-containing protein n=1 Tax=uncultured Thiohalocapsa sp. TaxID=768990 RepID=UPI0025FB9B50|nr:dockerin type I domain-containing protein [uncultured Thiohalocapsa sp.]